jgi:hypothetical protein
VTKTEAPGWTVCPDPPKMSTAPEVIEAVCTLLKRVCPVGNTETVEALGLASTSKFKLVKVLTPLFNSVTESVTIKLPEAETEIDLTMLLKSTKPILEAGELMLTLA